MAGAFRAAIAATSLGEARPSYRAQSPVARARQLQATRLGRDAMRDAGVKATPRTIRGWLTGRHQPSKANREALARAYDAMRRGGIPEWVKSADMKISGVCKTGEDARDRGSDGHAPLLVDMSKFSMYYDDRTYWQAIEDAIAEGASDEDLEELLAEAIEQDIGGSDTWEFPGSAYTVTFTG